MKILTILTLSLLLSCTGADEAAKQCTKMWNQAENTSAKNMSAAFMETCCDNVAGKDSKTDCAHKLLLNKQKLIDEDSHMSLECE